MSQRFEYSSSHAQAESIIADLSSQLTTLEEFIRLKDERIAELLQVVQLRDNEVKKKEKEIRDLKNALHEFRTTRHNIISSRRRLPCAANSDAFTRNENGAESDDETTVASKNPPTDTLLETGSEAGDTGTAAIANSAKGAGEVEDNSVLALTRPDPTVTPASPRKRPRKKDISIDQSKRMRQSQRPWGVMYEDLAAFKRKYGMKKMPNRELFPELHSFHKNERQKYNLYRSGQKPCCLTPEQIEKLEALGFAETCRKAGEAGWDERFHELQEYHRQHGHFRVSRHDNYQLWGWVKTQRSGYKNVMADLANGGKGDKKKGSAHITAEHMAKLQSIGFEWEVQAQDFEAAWEQRFTELLQYKSEQGTTHVPRNYEANLKLAWWIKGRSFESVPLLGVSVHLRRL